MDYMQILDRLVSIKNNAHRRAFINLMENPGGNQYHTKADTLESGINGLIMEIQNTMLAEQLLKDQSENQYPLKIIYE